MSLKASDIMKIVDKILAEMDAENGQETATNSRMPSGTPPSITRDHVTSTTTAIDWMQPTMLSYSARLWTDQPADYIKRRFALHAARYRQQEIARDTQATMAAPTEGPRPGAEDTDDGDQPASDLLYCTDRGREV
jgi:hypothetical protein